MAGSKSGDGRCGDHVSRRQALLGLGAAAGFALFGLPPAFGAEAKERRLKFHNIHTGESVNAVYATPEGYDEDALLAINRVLRDFRTGEVHTIDVRLLDLVHVLRTRMDAKVAFDVISGYRSPKTNAKLRTASTGVAKKSYHMKGMAIDLALPGRDIRDVWKAALALKGGGVGLYTASGFVHMDVGPVRAW